MIFFSNPASVGNLDIAKLLCTHPLASGLAESSSAVGWACYTNRVEMAKLLVAHGCEVGLTDDALFGGRPPLIVAAENAALLAIKWLVDEMGQDLHVQYYGGGVLAAVEGSRNKETGEITPGHVECARWLRQRGAVS